jgi:predicted nucleotidyltransferase component of viral defense system
MRLHADKELFEQVLTLTANSMKIDAAIVEKDYFVTMLLQEIVRRQPTIIFKGGTSLSKCYKLINNVWTSSNVLHCSVKRPINSFSRSCISFISLMEIIPIYTFRYTASENR